MLAKLKTKERAAPSVAIRPQHCKRDQSHNKTQEELSVDRGACLGVNPAWDRTDGMSFVFLGWVTCATYHGISLELHKRRGLGRGQCN